MESWDSISQTHFTCNCCNSLVTLTMDVLCIQMRESVVLWKQNAATDHYNSIITGSGTESKILNSPLSSFFFIDSCAFLIQKVSAFWMSVGINVLPMFFKLGFGLLEAVAMTLAVTHQLVIRRISCDVNCSCWDSGHCRVHCHCYPDSLGMFLSIKSLLYWALRDRFCKKFWAVLPCTVWTDLAWFLSPSNPICDVEIFFCPIPVSRNTSFLDFTNACSCKSVKP